MGRTRYAELTPTFILATIKDIRALERAFDHATLFQTDFIYQWWECMEPN